jgi:hypothetical protein
MEKRQPIIRELAAAGIVLPDGPIAPPYAVPAGYFEAFAAAVLARICREEAAAELQEISPLLAGLSRKMPFEVPQGYFEAAPVAAAPELPALLADIDRRMPYAVPEGYFATLPELMLKASAPKAKVVAMRPVRWMRMAAAAVIATAMAVGVWFYTQPAASLSADPQAWVQKRLTGVPDGALEEFIETADPVHGAELAQSQRPKAEVRQLLNDVSDKEVDAFLEQVPTDDESLNMIN